MAVLALATLCVGAYAAGLGGPFLMDDFDAIFPLAASDASGAGWWESLRQAPHHIRDRWLSNLSFLLTQAATGSAMPPQALAYKLGNLALHFASAAAMALLSLRLLKLWGCDAVRARWIALLGAGLFAVHPLLVSTVLYPVQRMAQLSTLFVVLAVWAYARWREALPTATARQHFNGIGLALGFTVLALLSKESGALAPLLIGVVELTTFRWPRSDDPRRGRFDGGFGLTCAAPLMLGGVALGLRWNSLMAGYAGRDFSLAERLLTQVHVLADYLGQIFLPRIAGMGLYRDDVPLQTDADLATIALALGFGVAVAGAVALRRRWPAVALGVLWFFAAHVLESSVIPLELVFEHRNYLAMFGPALAVAWTLGRLPNPVAVAIAIVLVLALGAQTARRAVDWRDYDRWIRSEAAHHPASLRAGTDLVMYLASRSDLPGASNTLERLRERFPDHAQPAILALALRCRASSIIPLSLAPDDSRRLRRGVVGKDAFHLYAGVREDKFAGRCNIVEWSAFAEVAGAVATNPGVTRYPTAAAAWHRLHAQALSESDDWPVTSAAIERAIEQQDDDPRDWILLMQAKLQMRDLRAYAVARGRLMHLTGGNLGILGPQVDALDKAADTLARAPAGE